MTSAINVFQPLLAEPVAEPTPPVSDRTLVTAAIAGNEDAFRALYRQYTPRLRGLVRRVLGANDSETDDVLQVVWLRAMLNFTTFRWNSTLSSWLCGIAIRAALESMRKNRREFAELKHDVVAPAQHSHTRLDITDAIQRVPMHYRAVFILHDIEGFTHEEIALQLHIAIGTSKANLHRARRLLRTLLGQHIQGEEP